MIQTLFHVIFKKYMCYNREHLLSNLDYVFPYQILTVHVFQLSMAYQHGITLNKKKEVITSLWLVFIFFIHKPVYFPQLIRLIAIFSTLFWSSCSLSHQKRIWNIDFFNKNDYSVISFYFLSTVYSMIFRNGNQLITSFMLVGQ